MNFGAPKIASTGQGARHLAQPMQRGSSIHATCGGDSAPLAGFSGKTGLPSRADSASMVAAPPVRDAPELEGDRVRGYLEQVVKFSYASRDAGERIIDSE